MSEALAIIIGYLLGSIPSAFLITRIIRGGDIRRMGGGNVGGLNVFREVSPRAALAVGVIDLGKGAAAVAIARWGLNAPDAYVILAGLAAVVGHNWMIWLKFSGGKGMGAATGALTVLLPAYGYAPLLGVFFAVILVPLLLTRNVALSMALGLFALPLIVWFGTHSAYGAIMATVLLFLIFIKFLPTALSALRQKGLSALGIDRWQRNKSR